MASKMTRAELVAEITKWRGQQMESIKKATFRCWTAAEEIEHENRGQCLGLLVMELEALDNAIAK